MEGGFKCVCVYVCTCVYNICEYFCVYVCTHICVYKLYVCVRVCVYVRMCVCTFVCVTKHLEKWTQAQSRWRNSVCLWEQGSCFLPPVVIPDAAHSPSSGTLTLSHASALFDFCS